MKKQVLLFILLQCAVQLYAQPKLVNSLRDGKFITVNGARLWVVIVGTGDPVILIPGGPGAAHYGIRDFDSLSLKGHQLIYFDGFGRGKSDTAKVVTEYSLKRDIEDVEGLRTALQLQQITILGHSYGGVVAQGYALKYSQHVSHLILANTFHSYAMWQANDDNANHEIATNYPEFWEELLRLRRKGIVSSDEALQDIYSLVPYSFLYAYNPSNFYNKGGEAYPNNFKKAIYYQIVGRDGDFKVGGDIAKFDYRKNLKNLKMPVLIIGGRYDRVAIPKMMVKYKEYCPQAQFILFEKSGHNPQVEEPLAEFELINSFLNNK